MVVKGGLSDRIFRIYRFRVKGQRITDIVPRA